MATVVHTGVQTRIHIPDPLSHVPHIPGLGPFDPVPGINSVLNNGGNIISATNDTAHFLGSLTNPNTWVRIGEFTFGAILVTVGLFAILKGPQRIETAMRTADKASKYVPGPTGAAGRAGKIAQARSHGTQVGRATGKQAARKIASAQ